jgi:hypothetical protein
LATDRGILEKKNGTIDCVRNNTSTTHQSSERPKP